MSFSALARSLPEDLRILLVDVGSAGGIHKRWRPIRNHVSAVLFDPLDQSTSSGRDRYFPVALAAGQGRKVLHVTRRVSMSSTLLPNRARLARFWDKPQHTEITSEIEVPTDSLDHIAASNGIAVDAIKIDVQGGEYDILLGARSCLETAFFVEVELSFFDRYVGLRPLHDVVVLMQQSGFELIDMARIKRYRYRNGFGVVDPVMRRRNRAGRLAFCDAYFMPTDGILQARLAASAADGDEYLALKLILVLLAYGKGDIAAWIHDMAADRIPAASRRTLSRYLTKLGRQHRFSPRVLLRALDGLAR